MALCSRAMSPAQIVKPIAAGFACIIEIDAVEPLHNVHMVGNLKRRHYRLAKAGNLHVFAVIPADRHAGIDNVGDHHHAFFDLPFKLRFTRFQCSHFICHGRNFPFGCLGLLALTARHHAPDLLADHVALVAQCIAAGVRFTPLCIERHNLIHENELFILEFFADILLHKLRIRAEQLDVNHIAS